MGAELRQYAGFPRLPRRVAGKKENGARSLVSRVLYARTGKRGRDSHFSGTDVAVCLERPTRKETGRRLAPHALPYLVFLRVGFTKPPPSPGALVRSYRTVSPLPLRSFRSVIGGLLSVALSLASRPVAVNNHPCPWSPDFPPRDRVPRKGRPTERLPQLLAPPSIIRAGSTKCLGSHSMGTQG